LNVLVNAGIPVRMISTYAAHHDKYLVVDGVTVQTGQFHYTDSAARRNSENVVVLWNYPNVAKDSWWHWAISFDQGVAVRVGY